MSEPITVAWLHAIRPDGWRECQRGIDYANWTIHSIRTAEEGYDLGPFIWSVAPSHGPNMTLLERPCETHFTILVLDTREDVVRLLHLLDDGWQACEHGVKDGDWCEPCNKEMKMAQREQLEGYDCSAGFLGGLANRPTHPDEVAKPIRDEVKRFMADKPVLCERCDMPLIPGQPCPDCSPQVNQ